MERLYYKIDFTKVTTLEMLLEILDAAQILLPPVAGTVPEVADKLILVNLKGEPVVPAFNEGDEFVLDGKPVGIILNKDRWFYVSANGVLYYYCVALNNADLGILEIEEQVLSKSPRYERSTFSTTTPPPPSTLADAVEHFLPRFDGFDKIITQFNSPDAFASFCHSMINGGIAMSIRNELRLWEDESPMHKYFVSVHNVTHPDEMSAIVVKEIYQRLINNNIPPTTRPETD